MTVHAIRSQIGLIAAAGVWLWETMGRAVPSGNRLTPTAAMPAFEPS
jgi:hypothetical protein